MKARTLSAADRRRLIDDGYTVVRAAVRGARLSAARRWIDRRLAQGARPVGGGTPADYWMENASAPELMALLFETPLWMLAQSLLGAGGAVRPPEAQVALRFPAAAGQAGGPALHVDGFYGEAGRPAKKVFRFALLIGVMLSDLPDGNGGNLVVCPGSHRAFAEFARKHGVATLSRDLRGQLGLGEPVRVFGRAGDAVLAHYQLAHDKGVNLSGKTRYMVYFRIHHQRAAEHGDRPFAEPWLELPGLGA